MSNVFLERMTVAKAPIVIAFAAALRTNAKNGQIVNHVLMPVTKNNKTYREK